MDSVSTHSMGTGRWRFAAGLLGSSVVLAPVPLVLWLLAAGMAPGTTMLGAAVAVVIGILGVMAGAGLVVRQRMCRPLAELRRLIDERADADRIDQLARGCDDGDVGRLAGALAEVLADLEYRRASGSRLALVASVTSNAVAITDAAGVISWCNDAFVRWFGTTEPLAGRDLGDVVSGDDPQRDRLLESFDRGEGRRDSFATTRSDGEAIHVGVDVQPVYDDDGVQSFVVVISDTTRQHELQAHVEAGRRRLEAILDAVPAIVMYRDRDGGLVHCNRAAARLFDATDARTLAGRPYTEVSPDHAEGALDADAAVFAGHAPFSEVLEEIESPFGRRTLRTARILLEDPLGGGDGVLAVSEDVTDQQSLERRLDFAMRTGNLGVWDWEPRRGTLTLSPQLLELLGHPPGGVEGTFDGLLGLVHEDDREKAISAIDSGVSGGEDRFRREIRIRRGDGAWQWMLLAGSVQLREISGRAERVVGVLIDIDRQKQVQADLTDALVQAEAAGRARTAFLASMSHELRTPLTAILGYAELLQDPAGAAGDLTHHAETIMRNGRHLVTLIDDILDLSRIEAGCLETAEGPVELGAIVRDLRDTVELAAQQKTLAVEMTLDGPVPRRVCTDAVRLRQILLGVAGNAVKFTDEGRVRIEIGASMEASDRCRLRFVVRDSGPGIPYEVQERLFQPFERADDAMNRRHGGSGLGLAIGQRLAGMLGGEITVDSRPGEGSVFTVSVVVTLDPAAGGEMASSVEDLVRFRLAGEADPADAPAPEAATEPHLPLDGRRILLAEDGPDNQRLISHHLRRAGAIVDVADDGAQAVRRLREVTDSQDEADFDLVVMDMQMPVQDGYAATRELRSTGFDLPVIALTAHAMTGDRERCLAAGCTDYATKPIDRRSLIARCAALSAASRQAKRRGQIRDAA